MGRLENGKIFAALLGRSIVRIADSRFRQDGCTAMTMTKPKSIEEWNKSGADYLLGLVGLRFDVVEPKRVTAGFRIEQRHLAPNGFLHAASVVALADSCGGYGTICSLPERATGFTTIDLASNFIGTARDGDVTCTARPLHQGRTTQVWDATVRAADSGKTIAHFRCTQMILYPRA